MLLSASYCFDTSVLINAWRRDYPRDVFGSFWSNLEAMIEDGKIVAPEEVRVELERKDDEILEWANQRRHMFVPIDYAIQNAVLEVLNRFPRLIDTRKNRSGADPFVVALALARGLTVVTYEKQSRNLSKPNIPDACDALHVECIGLLDMVRREQWLL